MVKRESRNKTNRTKQKKNIDPKKGEWKKSKKKEEIRVEMNGALICKSSLYNTFVFWFSTLTRQSVYRGPEFRSQLVQCWVAQKHNKLDIVLKVNRARKKEKAQTLEESKSTPAEKSNKNGKGTSFDSIELSAGKGAAPSCMNPSKLHRS